MNIFTCLRSALLLAALLIPAFLPAQALRIASFPTDGYGGAFVKKILVLEDEASIRSFIVINLRRAGYDVIDINCACPAPKPRGWRRWNAPKPSASTRPPFVTAPTSPAMPR